MSHQARREKGTRPRKRSIMETDRSRALAQLFTQQTQTTVESGREYKNDRRTKNKILIGASIDKILRKCL